MGEKNLGVAGFISELDAIFISNRTDLVVSMPSVVCNVRGVIHTNSVKEFQI